MFCFSSSFNEKYFKKKKILIKKIGHIKIEQHVFPIILTKEGATKRVYKFKHQEPYSQHLILFITYEQAQQVRVFFYW